MKFDVIIGNPPYQMSDGGGGGSAIPLYNKFVSIAKRLDPRFLTMIIPSRWFTGGRGLDEFRDEMLNDKRISKIFDFPNSSDCFPGVEIKGGVCYFLWDRGYQGNCDITTIKGNSKTSLTRPLLEKDINFFLRYNQSVSTIKKILNLKEKKIDNLVSSMKPFGFRTFFKGKPSKSKNSVKIYHNGGSGYVSLNEIKINKEMIDKHKVFITEAYGAGESFPHQILNKPFYGELGSVCTETYVYLGPFKSKKICQNVISYIKTKFFRFLVLMVKNTQHGSRSVYKLVPIQNFDEKITDEILYKKYDLNQKEIKFIDDMIRPME
jgi:site-specific DNA-methyltransferase (adenine-specific)